MPTIMGVVCPFWCDMSGGTRPNDSLVDSIFSMSKLLLLFSMLEGRTYRVGGLTYQGLFGQKQNPRTPSDNLKLSKYTIINHLITFWRYPFVEHSADGNKRNLLMATPSGASDGSCNAPPLVYFQSNKVCISMQALDINQPEVVKTWVYCLSSKLYFWNLSNEL